MASITKRGKIWHFRFVDADGRRVSRRGCADRRETERMASLAEMEVAKVRAGLADPRDFAIARHGARPLSEHLADWHADLAAKGSSAQHADLSRNRVARLIELAKAGRIADLSPSRVQGALKTVRDGGASLRTVHHYTAAVKGFGRWLWRDGRASENALAHLTSKDAAADRRHERRALTADEQARLIRAAESGPVVLKLSGADRAALYRVALGTGFRAKELRSLAPEAFRLDDDPPTVNVAAGYSKRGRDDVQPIRRDLAEALRPWLSSKAPGRPAFGNLSRHTNLLIQADLERAGIEYCDASGRFADFHALRHSYITALAMSRAPVKVIQSLARHSTPSLTLGTYSHVGLYDQTAALEALPGPSSAPEALAATGTEGRTHRKTLAPYLLHDGDASCHPESVPVAMTGGGMTTDGPILSGPGTLEITVSDVSSLPLSATDGAEGEGFEPPDGLHHLRFSRPSQSATLAPLRDRRVGRGYWPTSLSTSSAT